MWYCGIIIVRYQAQMPLYESPFEGVALECLFHRTLSADSNISENKT